MLVRTNKHLIGQGNPILSLACSGSMDLYIALDYKGNRHHKNRKLCSNFGYFLSSIFLPISIMNCESGGASSAVNKEDCGTLQTLHISSLDEG